MKLMKAATPYMSGDNCIPRFDTLRWAPIRFRGVLNLEVMIRYQCVVIGATQSNLTVAIADQQARATVRLLEQLTNRSIFPVLVDPARMSKLIQRIERDEQYWCKRNRLYYLPHFQLHLMVALFFS
jgi:Type II secretion system (T2SS), protein E, N-terminal domain